MPDYRVLLMDPWGSDQEVVTTARQLLMTRLQEAAPYVKVTVVLGTEEHDKSFQDCGGWPGWIEHVATGVDYNDRTPLFNAIAVLSEILPRATGQILSKALEARRMGLLVQGGTLQKVVNAVEVDPESWKDGWRAIVAKT